MTSWQAQYFNASVRLLVRRRKWGENEQELVSRARSLFGAKPVYQWLRTRGLQISRVCDSNVRGEWITSKTADEGIILYLHGGGYVSCSASTHRPITAGLARLSRFRVLGLDYRIAPEYRYPAALDDSVAAYQWLLEQGISPNAISVAGDSAGGGLVLGLLLRVRDSGLPLPACGVCFSAWTDLAGTGASLHFNNGRCAVFRPENIADFAAVYLGGKSPFDPYASPVYADLRGLPPLLLQVGSTELLLDDTRQVHNKIQQADGVSQLEVYDDVFHCWQMLDGIIPEAHAALRQAATFIRNHISISV
ncbi:MAG TPA: alpha/beta hydrolase [Pyrinomonadaceae bacterium]|nr:alpha/beta hydrolase [Pyrinomonadaceae bacterium]